MSALRLDDLVEEAASSMDVSTVVCCNAWRSCVGTEGGFVKVLSSKAGEVERDGDGSGEASMVLVSMVASLGL